MAAATAPIDLSGQQVAVIYGKAFFGAAQTAGNVDSAIAEFDSLVTDVLDANPAFDEFLANGMIGFTEKIGVLDRVFGSTATPAMLNFLKVAAENERLAYLRPILDHVRKLDDESKKRVQVQVATATPLEASLRENLESEIRTRLQLEPELDESIRPELVGGIVLQIGDTVFDGSVATELERMRGRLHARNIQEIETNRKRFQADGST